MTDFFNWLYTFFTHDIFQFLMDGFTWLITKAVIWWLEMKLWGIQFAWGIAKNVVAGLNISGHIASAMSGLNNEMLNTLTFFRVPDALNIILAALGTRFLLRFIPFL